MVSSPTYERLRHKQLPAISSWRSFTDKWPENSQTLALFILFLLMWGILYASQPHLAEPTSSLMRLLFLFVGAQLCAIVVSQFGVPDMLGMIFWGILYRNVGFADYEDMSKAEAFLR